MTTALSLSNETDAHSTHGASAMAPGKADRHCTSGCSKLPTSGKVLGSASTKLTSAAEVAAPGKGKDDFSAGAL